MQATGIGGSHSSEPEASKNSESAKSSENSGSSKGSESSALRRVLIAGLWLLTVLEVLGMGLVGVAKFTGTTWVTMFEGWGYPTWFTYVIGAGEAGGAVLLLVPRLASYAALMLMVIMLGALYTVLTKDNQLGAAGPFVHLGVLSVIAWARWSRRWRP